MKKPFVVEIQEVFRLRVVIWAEDKNEASELANEPCDTGEIDMDRNTYAGRDISVIEDADEDDLVLYDQYE